MVLVIAIPIDNRLAFRSGRFFASRGLTEEGRVQPRVKSTGALLLQDLHRSLQQGLKTQAHVSPQVVFVGRSNVPSSSLACPGRLLVER